MPSSSPQLLVHLLREALMRGQSEPVIQRWMI
jgi:hypothetical protein